MPLADTADFKSFVERIIDATLRETLEVSLRLMLVSQILENVTISFEAAFCHHH